MAWITVVWFRDQNGWQNMQWSFELDKLYINFTSIFKKWFLQTMDEMTLDGSDENTLPWRGQPSDEVTPDDEQAITDEVRKVIQWCQQVT